MTYQEMLELIEKLKKMRLNQQNSGVTEPTTPTNEENQQSAQNSSTPTTPNQKTQEEENSGTPGQQTQEDQKTQEEENSGTPGQQTQEGQPNQLGGGILIPPGSLGPHLKPKYRERRPTILTPDLSQTVRQSELKVRSNTGLKSLGLIILFLTISYTIVSVFLEPFRRRKEKSSSFFITTNFLHPELKLGAYLVFTDKAPQFKEELELEVDLDIFMVGRIIGILDESQSLIIIQVFPERIIEFQSSINFSTPFLYLDDIKVSSYFKIKFFLEDLVQGLQ